MKQVAVVVAEASFGWRLDENVMLSFCTCIPCVIQQTIDCYFNAVPRAIGDGAAGE